MTSLLPMSAIRVFEAAARHQSFTRAAAELGMTQAAVSYQIKVLEDRLGAPLFIRHSRQVTLTELGQRLAPNVKEAFDLLRSAFASAREKVDTVLAITSVQTFASNWLVPRLGSFQLLNPKIAVRLETDNRLVDFSREDTDVGLRIGSGKWPGLESLLLFHIEYTPFCSPTLLDRMGGVRTPSDLLRFPLLDPTDPWWPHWFAAAGLRNMDLSTHPDINLGNQHLEGTAALTGQGVALLTPMYFAQEIAAGRLVQVYDLTVRSSRGFWLVYPRAKRNLPKIRAFRDWLLDQIKADPPPLIGTNVAPEPVAS